MTDTTLLIGKYCIGTSPCAGPCRIEAAIDDEHYLVRFDADEGGVPEHLCVVALSDMVRAGCDDDDPPPWLFFDSVEQRAKFLVYLNDEPTTPVNPKLMPMSRRQH